MAYAFEKIMNAMDDGKVNVFGGQTTDTQGQQQQTNTADQGEMKTEATGDASGSGGGSGSGKLSFVQNPQVNSTVGNQRAMQAAKESSPVSVAQPLGKVSASMQKAQSDLQAEANLYKQNQLAKQNYEIPPPDIEKAIGGDREAASKVATTLSKTKADPVERFSPQTDYDIEELEQFKSAPGLSRYLRSQYGPRYTAGGAALDVGRLKADPQFQASVQNLENQQRLLRDEASKYQDPNTGLQKQVEDEASAKFAAQKKAVQDYLASQQAAIDAANEAEFQNYVNEVEAAKAPEFRDRVAQGREKDIAQRLAEVVRLRPELAKYLTPEYMQGFGINAGDFVNAASTEGLNRDRFYDAKEAARFNSIMGLLGQGGTGKVASEPVQPTSSFDIDRYLNSVTDEARNRNSAADAEARANLDRIISSTQGRYDAALKDYGSLDASRDRLAAEARAAIGGQIDPNLVDPNQFFKRGNIPSRFEDFVSESDANLANQAYEELLDPRRLQAGSMANYTPYTWDASGYQQALRNELIRRASPIPFLSQYPSAPPEPADRRDIKKPNDRSIIDQLVKRYVGRAW